MSRKIWMTGLLTVLITAAALSVYMYVIPYSGEKKKTGSTFKAASHNQSRYRTTSDAVHTPSVKNGSKDRAVMDKTTETERIKQDIYNVRVEYLDDMDVLDDFVQPSAKDPVPLWKGKWVSIDDWKRYDDTFSIDSDNNGKFRFIPEKDGERSYTYDKEKKEFVWVKDYYGKKITNKVKFIKDDMAVLLKISGDKVALDIYQRAQQ